MVETLPFEKVCGGIDACAGEVTHFGNVDMPVHGCGPEAAKAVVLEQQQLYPSLLHHHLSIETITHTHTRTHTHTHTRTSARVGFEKYMMVDFSSSCHDT